MTEISIRQLGAADAGALRKLNGMFGGVFGMPDVYQKKPPSDAYLRGLLAGEHFAAVVAEQNGEIVGGLASYILHKFERERREIYIYDLAVRPEFRRQKVATRLIRRVQKIAKERGAHVVFVQADWGDEPAVKLYESLGRREEVLHFDIPPENELP